MKKEEVNNPIRILQYIGSLETGGSQSMIMNIYRNIDRNKIQFDFVVDRKEDGDLFYKDEIESLGGKVYVFDEYFKGYNYFGFTRQWKDFFCAHPEYKIIHCHVRSVASIVLRIAKKYKMKTICHSHSTSNGSGIKSVIKKILQAGISKYCDYYLACSKESAEWLYGQDILKSEKCLIINNAIDVSRYRYNLKIRKKVRAELGLGERVVLGQVGRLEPVKNYVFSLELLSNLLKGDSNYHLLIVGKGSQKESIIEKAKELGVYKNITMLEDRIDVNELMQAMDIFIMPSLYEGSPLALIEAQATGLPCIVSNKISQECKITPLVSFLPISQDAIPNWRRRILKDLKVPRKDYAEIVIIEGYEINDTTKRLEKIYNILLQKKPINNIDKMEKKCF